MATDRLVWVDLEMTGLEEHDTLLEMACIITDGNLNIIAEAPDLIIHQSDDVLHRMGEWCTKHHGESGLTAASRESKLSVSEAEDLMVAFVRQHTIAKQSPLAGNSVHCDKTFLVRYMPKFVDHLHYRIVDVSTVKELCRRWYPEQFEKAPAKKVSHRALDDIKESIEELKYYRQSIFR